MRKHCILATLFFTLCLICASAICMPDTAFAKGITKVSQAKKLAKKQVKGATSIKVKKDHDDGVLVYQVDLVKGKKEYELTYRASDSKLLSQGWELRASYVKKGSGKLIGLKKCKSLAKKQVSNGRIISAVKKRSKGVDLYDIKMKKSNKKYELKYHARTGKLLEYEWELTVKADSQKSYISEEQAKQIALERAGSGTVVKVKFTTEDGVKVYEVDVVNEKYEYEVTIHAETGKVLDVDKEKIKSPNTGNNTNQAPSISKEQAKEIAIEAAGGGTVTKIKLDTDDGVKVYEVDVLNGDYEFDVEIDAATGDVLKVEKEFADSAPTKPSNPGQDSDQTATISEEQAKEIAIETAGGGTVLKIKLDTEDGVKVYEVDVLNGDYEYEVDILAATGAVLKVKKEFVNTGSGSGNGQPQPGDTQQISLEDAKAIAITDAGVDSADVVSYTKNKLDYEDGILVYEIEFFTTSYKYEYEINAYTGEIYSREQKKLQNGNGGNSGSTGEGSDYIGAAQAEAIAADHAGFSVSEVRFQKTELDREDGIMVYEVEFYKDGMEYEYEIDAVTGKILKFDQEWDD